MPIRFEMQGSITRYFGKFVDPDFTYLTRRIQAIMQEDHTRAILGGLDKDGTPFASVTYRGGTILPVKRGDKSGKGIGPALQNEFGNLSSSQYRRLTGPPLAPRGRNSRIIANYATEAGKSGNQWFVQSFLDDIVSRKGVPFMQYHFTGAGRNPIRDDRGIRPWGRERILAAVREEVSKIAKQP
jgi:hypothetical protein